MTGFFAAGHWWDVSADDQAVIAEAASALAAAGIEPAMDEARVLFTVAISTCSGSGFTQDPADWQGPFQSLITRRANREPMSHLLGYRDFYKHRFAVSPAVLDPRPDTETLIEEALKRPWGSVLDLGTGSGCILLSLLAERPAATGVGTDISDQALAVARTNRESLGLADRARFIRSDWYPEVAGTFDLIVSNPPYIAASEMADLQPEVRDHEPRLALTDEGDGLSCYRTIVAGAGDFLTSQGWLMVEIGPTQGASVRAMMADAGLVDACVTQDIDGRDRVVSARNPR